jgi:predicted acetyltransferase
LKNINKIRVEKMIITTGGHIGYDISPDFRNKGYGNMVLTLALEKAKAFELNEVVITCNIENAVSKKIIENHGGKFLGTIYDEEEDEHLYKYVK